ncbi:MAG: acylphosphatase [Alphaproteobacteria bacterium]
MASAARKTVRLLIHGRVQGVCYRAWAVDQAALRGVDGWVRNRRDGTVEAVLSGPAAEVDALIEACRAGPPHAQVSRIDVAPADETEPGVAAGTGFRQIPTP